MMTNPAAKPRRAGYQRIADETQAAMTIPQPMPPTSPYPAKSQMIPRAVEKPVSRLPVPQRRIPAQATDRGPNRSVRAPPATAPKPSEKIATANASDVSVADH